jgi:hypothetical protein
LSARIDCMFTCHNRKLPLPSNLLTSNVDILTKSTRLICVFGNYSSDINCDNNGATK